jgi:uncharacterized Zn-binding protein involved in type VI secretion
MRGVQVANKSSPGICTIIEGDARHRIDGRPVAYEGHKTSCGAALLASDPRLSIG